MEVDEIQRLQVCKFQRLISSNPNKIATQKANHQYLNEDVGGDVDGGGGGGRLCGWPSSRIVRVSRASGGKDRHSKVLTSKGLRDRRVRLSVTTAIQFYDLQDRLGYDQPSKAVEWLIKAASNSIAELPSLDPSFSECNQDNHYHHSKGPADNKKKPDTEFEDPNHLNNRNDQLTNDCNNNNISVSGSSTSETSKGSGLSLSRSENRMRARERAREMAAKKEKRDHPVRVNGVSENPSFTDLLTGGGISSGPTTVGSNTSSNPVASPESRIQWTTPMDYFFGRPPPPPQFNITAGENHHYSFLQENFGPVVTTGGGFGPGFNRGTLQSNLLSVLPHNHQQLQRFQSSSMVDGSTSTNFPFFVAPNIGSSTPENYPAATGYDSQRLQLYRGAQSDDRKEKSKN